MQVLAKENANDICEPPFSVATALAQPNIELFQRAAEQGYSNYLEHIDGQGPILKAIVECLQYIDPVSKFVQGFGDVVRVLLDGLALLQLKLMYHSEDFAELVGEICHVKNGKRKGYAHGFGATDAWV